MNGKGFWIVLGAGAAMGAAVALLYAPQSGVATRKKLRHGIEDAEVYLEDAGDYLKDQAEKLSREARKAFKTTRHRGAGDLLAGAARTVKSMVA